MINSVVIAGRLTRDIEVRHTQSGKAVGHFTLAIDRQMQKGVTDFIDCVLWNAEKIAPYLTKGKPISVVGSIQVRNWEDKEGNKRKVVEVKVDRISFLPDSRQQPSSQSNNDVYQEVPFTEDDLPF